MWTKRTDLAVEAKELWRESAEKQTELKGVRSREKDNKGYKITHGRNFRRFGRRSIGETGRNVCNDGDSTSLSDVKTTHFHLGQRRSVNSLRIC